MNSVMELEKAGDGSQRRQGRLARVLKAVRIHSHVLTEHATVIYTHSELALEETGDADHPLRLHLKAIHSSAEIVAASSKKLRQVVFE